MYVGSLYEIENTLIFTVLFNFNKLKGISFLAQDLATLDLSQSIAKNSVQFSVCHLPLSKRDSNLFYIRSGFMHGSCFASKKFLSRQSATELEYMLNKGMFQDIHVDT